MKPIKLIIEKHSEGNVTYPLGLKGVISGEGDTNESGLENVNSTVRFHIESFGNKTFEDGTMALEAFVAEAQMQI